MLKRFPLVRCSLIVFCLIGFLSGSVFAQERTQEERAQDILAANINAMRNQEVKAAVLQQLLNEEIGKLRQLQAVFCDQYKLDPEKFRTGQYIYDEKKGKFVEKKSE